MDISVALGSVVVESVASDVVDWVVSSNVELSKCDVVLSATVDTDTVVSWDVTAGPENTIPSDSIDTSLVMNSKKLDDNVSIIEQTCMYTCAIRFALATNN